MPSRNDSKEYLGRGLAFPLQIDAKGGLALIGGERDIEQAIRIILGTAPSERRMRPEFGCRIHELVFAPQNAATEALAARYVEEAVSRWEPRVNVERVMVSRNTRQDGVMLIEMIYSIKPTHDRRSIVYPLYLNLEPED
jgi:hypothetical protein